jgi:hypothetical protein
MKKTIDLKASNFTAVHAYVDDATLDGEAVVRVRKGDDKRMQFDENTYARLVGESFHNGTIEVDMRSRLLPDAPDFSRAFIGIAFRIDEKDSEFESFYIRPTNGRGCTDPVRKSHGCQYFSYPGYTFAYFREFGISTYEAPIEIGLDEWCHLKAVIKDENADFYLNGQLLLHVSGMKHGAGERGSVGFFVDIGTEAFYKNLTIDAED